MQASGAKSWWVFYPITLKDNKKQDETQAVYSQSATVSFKIPPKHTHTAARQRQREEIPQLRPLMGGFSSHHSDRQLDASKSSSATSQSTTEPLADQLWKPHKHINWKRKKERRMDRRTLTEWPCPLSWIHPPHLLKDQRVQKKQKSTL